MGQEELGCVRPLNPPPHHQAMQRGEAGGELPVVPTAW